MAFLSAAQIASIQATIATLLTDSAQIQRATLVSDGRGGKTASWATIATTTCFRAPFGRGQNDEMTVADQTASVVRWLITLPIGTDIRATDRIVTAGRTFEVSSPLDDTFGVDLQVVCVEVR